MDAKELAARISTARTEQDMTAEELAQRVRVAPRLVRRWERGVRPPLFRLDSLERALGVELCDEEELRGWKRERLAAHVLFGLCILPLLIVLLAYNHLPALLPIYARGDSTVWGKSWYWLPIAAALAAASYGLAFALRALPSVRAGRAALTAAVVVVAAADAVFTAFLARYAQIAAAAGYRAAELAPIPYLLAIAGAFYTLLGVFAPLLKKNLFLGIRCEGTLKDPLIWSLTHRFAFAHFQLCGLFCALVCVLMPDTNGIIAFVVGSFTMILFPIIYATRKMLDFYPEMNERPARRK